MCVLTLLYTCANTAAYVSSCCHICVLTLLYTCAHTAVSSYYYICVLTLLYTCAHTAVSSYYYTSSVLLLLHIYRPHTAVYVSSYYFIFSVLILLYMCPHTTNTTQASSGSLRCISCMRTHIVAGLQLGTCLLDPTRLSMWGSYETTYVSSYCYIYVLLRIHTQASTWLRRATLRWPLGSLTGSSHGRVNAPTVTLS